MKVCCVPGCPELTLGSRCEVHKREARRDEDQRRGTRTARGLDSAWVRLRDRAVREHVRVHGWMCPGWKRPPHPVGPGQLTGDHIIPRAVAPELRLERSNVAVLCLACNSAKGATQ